MTGNIQISELPIVNRIKLLLICESDHPLNSRHIIILKAVIVVPGIRGVRCHPQTAFSVREIILIWIILLLHLILILSCMEHLLLVLLLTLTDVVIAEGLVVLVALLGGLITLVHLVGGWQPVVDG